MKSISSGLLAKAGEVVSGSLEVEKGIGLTTRLNRTQIKDYLANIKNISREQLVNDLKSLGLKYGGGSEDGQFMTFIDKQGRTIVRLDGPHRSTPYSHMHIYTPKEQSLSAELEQVSRESREAHIEIHPEYEYEHKLETNSENTKHKRFN